jgi:hypothetical protein
MGTAAEVGGDATFGLTEAEQQLKVLYLIGILVEAVLYGASAHPTYPPALPLVPLFSLLCAAHESIYPLKLKPGHWAGVYSGLFIAALPVLCTRQKFRTGGAGVFVLGNALMFVLTSCHSGQFWIPPTALILAFTLTCLESSAEPAGVWSRS